jgi:hypothetical protein
MCVVSRGTWMAVGQLNKKEAFEDLAIFFILIN